MKNNDELSGRLSDYRRRKLANEEIPLLLEFCVNYHRSVRFGNVSCISLADASTAFTESVEGVVHVRASY